MLMVKLKKATYPLDGEEVHEEKTFGPFKRLRIDISRNQDDRIQSQFGLRGIDSDGIEHILPGEDTEDFEMVVEVE